jgi:hypothetical protein
MTCPEIINPKNNYEPARINNFITLHIDGKQLITEWYQRAFSLRNCNPDSSFESFIYLWFAFNAWASCVTDTDNDREIINILSADINVRNDFAQILGANEKYSSLVLEFTSLFPIFDARELRRKSLDNTQESDRQELIKYYLSHGADKFAPKCWQRHRGSGESIPCEWGHVLNAIYQIRCNLFHGQKSANSEMDQRLVYSAYRVLIEFLNSTDYFLM